MLVDINFKQSLINEYRKKIKEHCTPERFKEIKNHIPRNLDDIFHKVDTGIYYSGLNFDHRIEMLSNDKIKDKFDSFTFMKRINGEVNWDYIRKCMAEGKKHKDNYGVCDDYQQVLEHYPELNNEKKKFVLSLCKISKNEQPESGGWRWHKWGEYIDNQNSHCEYIYDEPEIEEVYIYHIYEME